MKGKPKRENQRLKRSWLLKLLCENIVKRAVYMVRFKVKFRWFQPLLTLNFFFLLQRSNIRVQMAQWWKLRIKLFWNHFNLNFIWKYKYQNIMPKGFHLNGLSFSSLHFLLLYSSKTEIRFPVNIGITGHVATTGEVILWGCFQIKVMKWLKLLLFAQRYID